VALRRLELLDQLQRFLTRQAALRPRRQHRDRPSAYLKILDLARIANLHNRTGVRQRVAAACVGTSQLAAARPPGTLVHQVWLVGAPVV
jgi:hypothetical protein